MVRPRHPRVDRGDRRLLHEGAAARSVREAARAGRGHRGGEAGTDLDGGRVRAAEEDQHDPHRARRLLRARLRPLQPGHAVVALPREEPARDRRVRSRPAAQPQRHRRPADPAVRGEVLRQGVPEEPGEGAGHRRRAHRAVGAVHPAAVLGEQPGLVRDPRHPAVGAHHVGVRDGRAGALRRRARTGCAAWARRSRRCTSSSSAASVAGSSPASPPTPSARGHGHRARCAHEHHRWADADERGAVHPQRPVTRRRRVARRAGRAPQAQRGRRTAAGAAAREHRLLVRAGTGVVRRQLRGRQRRDARAARHERRRQVDDPA